MANRGKEQNKDRDNPKRRETEVTEEGGRALGKEGLRDSEISHRSARPEPEIGSFLRRKVQRGGFNHFRDNTHKTPQNRSIVIPHSATPNISHGSPLPILFSFGLTWAKSVIPADHPDREWHLTSAWLSFNRITIRLWEKKEAIVRKTFQPANMVLTHTTTDTYNHPFPTVTLAYFLRYSSPKLNPFSTHVLSTDTLESYVDPTTGRLHTTRIHLKKSRLPATVFKLLPSSITGGAGSGGEKASYILETSTVDMRQGWMRTESRNLNFNNVLSVVERQNFDIPSLSSSCSSSCSSSSSSPSSATSSSPPVAASTGTSPSTDAVGSTNVTTTIVYRSRLGERLRAKKDQFSSEAADFRENKWISGWVTGLGQRGIQRSIENLASSKTEAQIGKSREGMRVVLERLRHAGVVGVLEMMRRERQAA
ncbi:hypothetical protein SODALDRAFT_361192 [Sodiomyces alkalinus F11]|uniref:PRELI/MSF1 domain-containing protein n=1 Tax=Sodiomyces alkalinus (strain CBS 110278 / VKM F-3762 / F11) TaxID=1314773 RepID=A0A3N2PSI8_SODAK|nr:hypothetical protein SODALDRAFT_361192 [Sodiomyces alkalinus F11]ROT37481.1 hypothetical protein SODALDRAFT_361192 [Sodiomyces alkalinus F11]